MKFVDSNIVAYAFYANEFQEKCQRTIREENLITDAIVLVEAFNIIEFQTSRENATLCIKALLKSNITIKEVNINIIFESLKRANKYPQLKFIDLIHYTIALLEDCDSVLSYDHDFNNLEIPREELV
ncbi:PIN domain-containing protein [Candidatus Woesearchaeota archaeon]|nr:PIN domain-containing protein [Candidatus Woesearchaeota archaeon]